MESWLEKQAGTLLLKAQEKIEVGQKKAWPMPCLIGCEEYYDNLRTYFPEATKAISDKETTRTRNQIDGQIDELVKGLGT